MLRRVGPGYLATAVYCFGEGLGQPVKLGVSECIVNRFQMIRTHTWRDTCAFWAWWGDKGHEAEVHRIFGDRRIKNEWFDDKDDAIKNFLPNNMPKDGFAWPIKLELQNAIRRRTGRFTHDFPGYRPSYSITHEKQFEHFNAHFKDEIAAFCADYGIALDDRHFAPRDGREIEAAIAKVSA